MAHTTHTAVRLVALALLAGTPLSLTPAVGTSAGEGLSPLQAQDAAPLPEASDAPEEASDAPEEASDAPEDIAEYERSAMSRAELLGPYFDELSVLPGFESGGLAEGSDDLESYWSGELPPRAEAVIRDAEAHGRTVRIVHVAYSYDEIWQHSLDLVTALEEAGIEVGGFGPDRAHAAIELMGPELSVDAQMQAAARAIAASVLPADIEVAFIPQEGGMTFGSSPYWESWFGLEGRATFDAPLALLAPDAR